VHPAQTATSVRAGAG